VHTIIVLHRSSGAGQQIDGLWMVELHAGPVENLQAGLV
jgi:hypothetical protein